jgi:hypothetical protein
MISGQWTGSDVDWAVVQSQYFSGGTEANREKDLGRYRNHEPPEHKSEATATLTNLLCKWSLLISH